MTIKLANRMENGIYKRKRVIMYFSIFTQKPEFIPLLCSVLWSAAAESKSGLWICCSFAMELESYYEISRTADFIHTRNFTTVALQVLELDLTMKSFGLVFFEILCFELDLTRVIAPVGLPITISYSIVDFDSLSFRYMLIHILLSTSNRILSWNLFFWTLLCLILTPFSFHSLFYYFKNV